MPSKDSKRGISADKLETVPDTSSPAYASGHPISKAFDVFAAAVTRWAGSPVAFSAAVVTIAAWVVSGPIFHYSDAWQLVINTGTTIITFLMVFLIQQSQNKDSVALHLKLNELLASQNRASNRLIGIEDVGENDLRKIAAAYLELAQRGDQRSRAPSDVDQCVEDAKEKQGNHRQDDVAH
ncbi:low affinity iron permease family protein [Burkholderia glumae]|uniref:low affinity iron permease family protein n=1 Tax=Burkholderia glumae TaxID=337 RepID=UPI002150725C|nr:low affinity iron permease family protein [Burkholderia glumae]